MEKASFVHQIMSHASRPERRWRYWRRDSIVLIWKLLLPVKFFPIVQLTFAVFPFSISLCSIRNPPRGSVPYKSKFSFFCAIFRHINYLLFFFIKFVFVECMVHVLNCLFYVFLFVFFTVTDHKKMLYMKENAISHNVQNYVYVRSNIIFLHIFLV